MTDAAPVPRAATETPDIFWRKISTNSAGQRLPWPAFETDNLDALLGPSRDFMYRLWSSLYSRPHFIEAYKQLVGRNGFNSLWWGVSARQILSMGTFGPQDYIDRAVTTYEMRAEKPVYNPVYQALSGGLDQMPAIAVLRASSFKPVDDDPNYPNYRYTLRHGTFDQAVQGLLVLRGRDE
jgi:hypothetical protein